MKKILSIDGGGMRGIIPARILGEIERRTGKPIASLFDLIAGTSTGGIIALGLTKPDDRGKPQYTADDMLQLYEREGPYIFTKDLFRTFISLGNLVDEKYPSHPVERVLSRYFKRTYLDEALTNLLITSYEIERRDAFFFKSWRAKKDTRKNFLMRDVARATSAAPTYFEPERICTQDTSRYFALVDGGVFANNPAMCAYAEAKVLFPQEKDFLLLSLGTGELTRPIYITQSRGWGVAQWARPILNVVFDGVNDTVHYQLKHLLPRGKDLRDRYYRLQVVLDDASDDLDNTEPRNLRMLNLHAESLLREKEDVISDLCTQLAA